MTKFSENCDFYSLIFDPLYNCVVMKNLLYTVFVFASLFALNACNKLENGIAEVKVIDKEGDAQQGVHVTLFCTDDDPEKECVVETKGITNTLGVYKTEFELPVVLRVRAVRYDTTITLQGLPPNQIEKIEVDSLCGEGFITIENNEIASEVITILDCK